MTPEAQRLHDAVRAYRRSALAARRLWRDRSALPVAGRTGRAFEQRCLEQAEVVQQLRDAGRGQLVLLLQRENALRRALAFDPHVVASRTELRRVNAEIRMEMAQS